MGVVNRLYDKLGRDNIFFMAAGLAFSVVTTLIPLLMLLFAAVGYALASSDHATERVISTIHQFLPFASQEVVDSLLSVVRSRGTIGVIGLVGLIWAATGVVSSIRTVLNTVFEVPETRSLVAGKLFDLVMVVVLGVFFIISVGLTAVVTAVQDFGTLMLHEVGLRTDWVQSATALTAAVLVNIVMFALLYTTAPARRVPLPVAAAGATVAALLFELAKQIFRLYIALARQGTLGPASGTLGALILLLLWIYYSALVFILGGEMAFALGGWHAARTARRAREASREGTAETPVVRQASAGQGGVTSARQAEDDDAPPQERVARR